MTAAFPIAFVSPHGSTQKVAETIADRLLTSNRAVTVTDLCDPEAKQALIRAVRSDRDLFLFIGSPVYANVAVPPVMDFIDEQPRSQHFVKE